MARKFGRRPHRRALRLTAEQADLLETLAQKWSTFGFTATFERMLEHCQWELLDEHLASKARAGGGKINAKPGKNGHNRRGAQGRKGGKP